VPEKNKNPSIQPEVFEKREVYLQENPRCFCSGGFADRKERME
jgi:hypothetical protein